MKKILLIIVILFMLVGCDKKNSLKEKQNTNDKPTEIPTKNDSEIPNDIVGRWVTVRLIGAADDKINKNLKDAFDSSFVENSSYFELKADGTFIDASDAKNETKNGTYEVGENLYIIGDYYVVLHYADGSIWKLRKYLNDKNEPYLVSEKVLKGYKLILEKQ